MHPRTRFAAVALTAAGLACTSIAPAFASEAGQLSGGIPAVYFHGDLVKLRKDVVDPTDAAHAQLLSIQNNRSSQYYLTVTNLDKAAAGKTLGVHLHTGTCVAGDGAAAGPHYNMDAAQGATKPYISRYTEIWLDIKVGADGKGAATSNVPFAIKPGGSKALVVHEKATDPVDGMAGARLACLPVDF